VVVGAFGLRPRGGIPRGILWCVCVPS